MLLVDPHPVLRAALRLLLDSQAGLTVVGETTALIDAVTTVDREQVDIVLVEESLTERSLDSLQSLASACYPAHVIVFTDNEPAVSDQRAAVRAGVKGIVHRDASLDTLMSAIERVHAGEVWLPRALLASALSDIARSNGHATGIVRRGCSSLTRREVEVIALICDGLTNRREDRRRTVHQRDDSTAPYFTSIFAKLGVGDRLKLVVYTYRHGLSTAPTVGAVT